MEKKDVSKMSLREYNEMIRRNHCLAEDYKKNDLTHYTYDEYAEKVYNDTEDDDLVPPPTEEEIKAWKIRSGR